MNRLFKAAVALVCAFGLTSLVSAQLTPITASKIYMGGVLIPAGTVTFTPVNSQGVPIPFAQGGGGLNSPTAFSGTITAGAITGGFQVPDACLTTPANILYSIQITNTATQKAFTLQSVPGVCGSSWALDAYGPPAQTTNIQNIQVSYGTAAPSNSCISPSLYIRNASGGQLYMCVAGLPVLVTGSGGASVTYGTTAGTAAEGNDARILAGAAAAATADDALDIANAALPLAGGTMSGPLALSADPTTSSQAATKHYVDANAGAATATGIATALGTPPGMVGIVDSIGNSTGATNLSLGYFQLLRPQVGGNFLTLGVPGDMALDSSKYIYQAVNPVVGGTNYLTEIGTNDTTTYNSNTNLQTTFQRIITGNLLQAGLPSVSKKFAQVCTKTTGFATVDNAYINGMALISTVPNDKLTCSVVVGPSGTVDITYLIANANAGTFTVSINGTLQTDPFASGNTFNAQGDGGATITTTNGTTQGFAGAIFTGFTPGATVPVVFTNTSAAAQTVEIGWAGSPSAVSNPHVEVVSPNHQNNANDALSGIYAGYESAIVTTLNSYGFNLTYANTRDAGVNSPLCGNGVEATMFANCYYDAIHPNNTYHALMASTIAATIPALITNAPPSAFQGPASMFGPLAATPISPLSMWSPNPYNLGDGVTTWAPGITFFRTATGVYWVSADPVHGIYLGAAGGASASLCNSLAATRSLPQSPSQLNCQVTVDSQGTFRGGTSTSNGTLGGFAGSRGTTYANGLGGTVGAFPFYLNGTYNILAPLGTATASANFNSVPLLWQVSVYNGTVASLMGVQLNAVVSPGTNGNTYVTLGRATNSTGTTPYGMDFSASTLPNLLGTANAITLTLNSTTAATCSATIAGQFQYTQGNSTTKDIVQVCAHDATNSYAWRAVY